MMMSNLKQRVLIIGGTGYIGSRLYDVLEANQYDVNSLDLEWFGNHSGVLNDQKDFNTLKTEELVMYDAIVLLAGHSSVKMSGDGFSTLRNNVHNFVELINKMPPKHAPKLLYASSSSVYGDSKNKYVKEDDDKFVPNNFYDLSKHEIDMYATMYNSIGRVQLYGMRFGTVNGWSHNLRSDVMINAMYATSSETGEINLFNPQVHRPILGIEDLCKAVMAILEKGTKENVGLYNISSFTLTSEEIARRVSAATEARVMLRAPKPAKDCNMNIKLQTMAYDFSMDTTKFKKTFDFKFTDTVESIVKTLKDKEFVSVKTYRNENKLYLP